MNSSRIKNEITFPAILISKQYKDIYLFLNENKCTLIYNVSGLATIGETFDNMLLENFELYTGKIVLEN